jgi:hypothetical protein
MDPNLDKTIHVGSADFASNLGGPANLYIPIHPLPLPLFMSEKIVFVGKMLPLPPPLKHGTHDAPGGCLEELPCQTQ